MFELKAEVREINKNKENNLKNLIPAEVYGHNFANKHVNVERIEFEKLFNKAGESSLINLQIKDNEPIAVLVKDLQLDPVSDKVIHIDFYVVKMGEKLNTEIPLEFIGIAKAVKELGGILIKSITAVPVSCLPKDLVSKIEVDISALTDFDKVISVGDLKLPEGIEVNLEDQVAICLVQEPRVEKTPAEEAKEASVESESKEETNEEDKEKKEENTEAKK